MKPSNVQEFSAKAKALHGDRFDYSAVVYINCYTKVQISCSKHGSFLQTPHQHLHGQGCRQCAIDNSSWPESDVLFLKKHYVAQGPAYCQVQLKRSAASVHNKAVRLGIGLHRNHPLHDMSPKVFTVLCRNARKRGLKVEISMQDIWDIYLRQDRRCALTGWPVSFHLSGVSSASVDRIDSAKDYTLDNSQIVHKDVNLSKMDHDELRFYAICRAVHLNRAKDFEPILACASCEA